MHSVTIDVGLNFLWLAISVSALLLFRRCDWKRRFAVILATVALFPAVSDTDDLFSFSFLHVPTPHHRDAGNAPEDQREKNDLQLSRLLESLDHYQPASFFEFALALCCLALAISLPLALLTRFTPTNSGRAPPSACSLT